MRTRARAQVVATLVASVIAVGCKSKEPAGENKEPTAPTANEDAGKPTSKATGQGKSSEVKPPPPASNLPEDSGKHSGAHRWSLALGGETKDTGRAVDVGPSGDVAVVGYLSTKAKMGAETLEVTAFADPKTTDEVDAYVAVFDKDGKPKWTRQLGGKGEQIASGVAFDSTGNVIVVGWFGEELSLGEGALSTAGADDIFVAKFAADGRRLWAKRFGGVDTDAADDLVVDAAGNIFVTGVFRTEADFAGSKIQSNGKADAYLLKLNPEGQVVFVNGYGERYDDFGRSVAVDTQGNVILFGEFSNKVSFGGPALQSTGNRDLFIAKLTSAGEHVWSKGMGTDLDELGLAVATDPADNVIITGSFEDKMSFGGEELAAKGRGDVFLAKFDRDGQHQWSKRFGGKDEDIGSGLATDSFGNIFVTGWYWFGIDFGGGALKSNGKKDIFVAKLAPNGSHLWSKGFGNKEYDTGRAVAVADDGAAVVCGTFRYKLNLGGNPLPYAKKEGGLIPFGDVFLAKFDR